MIEVTIDNKIYEGNVVEVTNCGVATEIDYGDVTKWKINI